MQKATFLERVIAFVIDGVILSIVGGIAGAIFSVLGALISGDGSNGTMVMVGSLLSLVGSLVQLVIYIAYDIYFWTNKNGQTPGKMIMKIKVVTVEGNALTVGNSVMRVIGYFVSSFVCMIGYLWPLFDKDQQAWHDKIAKTYVVKA